MEYININHDLCLVQSKDKVFSKNELFSNFEKFINDSGYKIEKWINRKKAPYELFIVDSNNVMIYLILYLKNVTGAGWIDKPNIKRVQVSNIKIVSPNNYIGTTQYQTIAILGYYNFDNNPIMIAWDAYEYVNHKTMRSCYITTDSLKRGYENEYLVCNDASQKVWIFNSNYFDEFIKDYIKYNSNEEK